MEITTELEKKVLSLPADRIRMLLANEETAVEENMQTRVHLTWKEVDSGLEELPTAFCDIATNLMIEWTYLIDLDREVFAVNSWIFFDLWDIPRERWIEAFEYDCGDRWVFSFDLVPEASDGLEPRRYFGDAADERDNYCAMYRLYESSVVQAISDCDLSSPSYLRQIVAVIAFEELCQRHASGFRDSLLGWGHDSFAFREMAFAILSFAAGRFYFDRPDRYYGRYDKDESNGYLIDRNGGDEPQLMPLFGCGCHSQNQEPGSAPPGIIYWFESVLISLVPDTVFENDTEAAIARAVTSGLEQGHLHFQIVVFSVLRAILLEVHVADGSTSIKRTELLSICDATTRCCDPSDDPEDESHPDDLLGQVSRKRQGFTTIQNFFETAADRRVVPFGQGRFPMEIYARIIAKADNSTLMACEHVSRTFRMLCAERFAFSHELTILDFEGFTAPSASQKPRRYRPWNLSDVGTFTLFDESNGCTVRSRLNVDEPVRIADRKRITTWCPVIGRSARPSMMTAILLRLSLGH